MLSGWGTALASLAVQQPDSCLADPLPRKDKDLWSHLIEWTSDWRNWFQPCYSSAAGLISRVEAEWHCCASAAGWPCCSGHTDYRGSPQLHLASCPPGWQKSSAWGECPTKRCGNHSLFLFSFIYHIVLIIAVIIFSCTLYAKSLIWLTLLTHEI